MVRILQSLSTTVPDGFGYSLKLQVTTAEPHCLQRSIRVLLKLLKREVYNILRMELTQPKMSRFLLCSVKQNRNIWFLSRRKRQH